jgi:hypothetical protein
VLAYAIRKTHFRLADDFGEKVMGSDGGWLGTASPALGWCEE